jgi:hypothetical protein
MLLGVFSMDREKEIQHLEMIRDTYLSYYKLPHHKHSSKNLTSNFLSCICSLGDLQTVTGKLDTLEDRQLVYTFVVGAANSSNSNTLTQLLNNFRPMLVDRTLIPNWEEDVMYLHIRETINEGKSLTWFKHALSNIAKEFQIDLIFKVDMDTMLFPERVLGDIQQKLRYSNKTPWLL